VGAFICDNFIAIRVEPVVVFSETTGSFLYAGQEPNKNQMMTEQEPNDNQTGTK